MKSKTKIESEIKVSIKNITSVREMLGKIKAKPIGKTAQKDVYFSPPHMNFAGTLKYYLRIRSGRKNSIDYHIVHDDINTEEHEVKIEDPQEMEKIMLMLGFKIDCVVEKIRKEYTIKGFIIAIDQVKNLGNFVEVESVNKSSYKKLLEVAERLGIKESDIVSGKGYPDMIMELKKNG